jgi:hypothetical protein
MENIPHLTDFVTLIPKKEGYQFYQSITQQANIYRWLAKQGYGRCELDGKMIVYKKTGGQINKSSVQDMKDAFHECLTQIPYDQLPDELNINDVREWDYRTSPLKQNNLFRHYLTINLTAAETHQYQMKTDGGYAHRHRITQTLAMLHANGFKHTADIAKSFMTGSIIYYKPVDLNQYLLFIHHNSDLKANDCFEYCLASYSKESNIGRVKNQGAVNSSNIFYIERDLPLVEKYLMN